MSFNLFYNPKFEKLVNDLGVTAFGGAISVDELTAVRDHSKNVLRVKPEEAAARAFRDLLLLNKKIPIEQRLDTSFPKLGLTTIWEDVSQDLYLEIETSIRQLVKEYVGEQYENDFYGGLAKMGVELPIKHYMLRTIALVTLYRGKKLKSSPTAAAYDLYKDIILKNPEVYSSCLTEEGRGGLKMLTDLKLQ